MPQIVLVGDSIFDNARYVQPGCSVIEQLRRLLPSGWQATLAAADGATAKDALEQLDHIPPGTAHLFVSAGGNDAYNASGLLDEDARTVRQAMLRLSEARAHFATDYEKLLREVASLGRRTAVCTVYDAIPGLGEAERTALSVFNDAILRTAFAARFPVIDLRSLCDQAADYSDISPVEPSAVGGFKIAQVIVRIATSADLQADHVVISPFAEF